MDVIDLLRLTVDSEASDLHLWAGKKPALRLAGELISQAQMHELTSDDTRRLFEDIATEEQRRALARDLELDFAFSAEGIGRFRVNVHFQMGSIAIVFRTVHTQVPSIDELGLPLIAKDLVMKPYGLIVLTGPTGCGKSTTLAAMMEYLNERMRRKVITIEDPIEYVHHDKKCSFSQREIGRDTRSFASALKHALRQDPDVILVGEMRDLETVATALTAAETGHLVLTTLHTPGTAQTMDRIIDAFPPHQQQQVRLQLATTLEGILYQNLVPRADGAGLVAAVEVLIANIAIRSMIREGKTHQMLNTIQTGSADGMQTLDDSLIQLFRRKLINREEAIVRSRNPQEFERLLGF
ncbi:MAG: type IV pilus twitching motility protein PilT [Chloroflexi bacterium]|jgi:twitching motility protein PilT|nr:type IV pilus twitching motility protein PilT [Chloroflexota bacterium]